MCCRDGGTASVIGVYHGARTVQPEPSARRL